MSGTDVDTKVKDKDVSDDDATEGSLPPGHPRAGYVPPDLSEQVDTGKLPPEEEEWNERRDNERKDKLEEVEKAEGEAVKEEQEERERQAEENEKDREKAVQEGRLPAPPATTVPPTKSSKASSGS